MKNTIKTSLLLAILTSALFAFMPSKTMEHPAESKVIVLINHADWCPVCKSNSTRVKTEVVSKFSENASYDIILNDRTNKKTVQASSGICKKSGIDDFAKKNKSTGTIYFIKSTDKTLISKISVAETSEKIIAEFNKSLTN